MKWNWLLSKFDKDVQITRKSKELVRQKINNVQLNKRFFYMSNEKAKNFLESVGIKVPTEENEIKTGTFGKGIASVGGTSEKKRQVNWGEEVKAAIKRAKGMKRIVPYEQCERGRYILIHVPCYNGTVRLKTIKTYLDIYWWYSNYGNIRIYACGNSGNVIDNSHIIDMEKPLWDPSSDRRSEEFFDMIENYIKVETTDIDKLSDEAIISQLRIMIHDGTMRGEKYPYSYGEYDMLLRCDAVEREKEIIQIFGSPVFVTF